MLPASSRAGCRLFAINLSASLSLKTDTGWISSTKPHVMAVAIATTLDAVIALVVSASILAASCHVITVHVPTMLLTAAGAELITVMASLAASLALTNIIYPASCNLAITVTLVANVT